MSFKQFCEQATDRQLANIIHKEHQNNHPEDRDVAEREALKRGKSDEDVKAYRKQGAP